MKVSKNQIIDYYEACEIDYKLLWNLKRSYAMHFGWWDETVKSFSQALERENEILAEKAKVKNADIVLDAGCGVGGSSIFLAKRFGCKVTGITLTKKQVETSVKNAQQNNVADRTAFFEMDFENMEFLDETFDVVWSIESVCHADNKENFIEEAYRVLRPGGRIIIADGFAAKDVYTPDEQRIMDTWLNGWGVNYLESDKNFKKLLQEAGFLNISFFNATIHALPSSKKLYYYSLLGLPFGKIAEFLRLRKSVQTRNIVAAYYQYKALKHRLWLYGIVYAEK